MGLCPVATSASSNCTTARFWVVGCFEAANYGLKSLLFRYRTVKSPLVCILRAVEELPEYVAVSPVAIICPRCHAEPGDVCELLLGEGLEIVHVERISLALEMDVSAQDRLARARILSKP